MNPKTIMKNGIIRTMMLAYSTAPIRCGLNQNEERPRKIIVSLTSYPARFQHLHIAIRSLLMQTVKPDAVILYLGEDSKDVPLPPQLSQLAEKGLRIEYREGNLRSHKKYYYALQEYPQDIVILVDDDMIYEPKLIERLMNSYEKYPHAVSAKRVHKMAKNLDGSIADYNHWQYEYQESTEPGQDIFSTTGFGTLLPPGCMDERVLNADLFMKECFAADDIWLKTMQLLKHTPTVYVPGPRFISLPDTQATSLSSTNVDEGRNDPFIENMERLFHVHFADVCSLVYTEEANYFRLRK